VVSTGVVDCRSSLRVASDPAAAHRQASATNPARKKTRNHPEADASAGRIVR